MNRALTIIIALAVLAGGILPGMAAAQPALAPAATDAGDFVLQEDDNATIENQTANASVSPGATLAGVIGAQQAEVQGAVEQRAFGLEVAAAATSGDRAAVLAKTQGQLQNRTENLEARLDSLKQARDNGNISEARFQAEATEISAQAANVRNLANSTERTAEHLPTDILEANGVNVTAIQMLKTNAENLAGPEVAAIAQSIAGPSMGTPVGPPESIPGAPPDGVPGEPPEDMPGNETETSDQDDAGNVTTTTPTTTQSEDDETTTSTTTTTQTDSTDGGDAGSDESSDR